MHFTLVTGGARSGKSDYAERLALERGEPTTFVATAQPLDTEMAERIARHRSQRPASWTTVEAPVRAAYAVSSARAPIVLLDCVTLLASNALLSAQAAGSDGEAAIRAEVDALLLARERREGRLIAVTNEVGLGVVPPTELGRRYRDALGAANRQLAAAADVVIFMVSGIPMVLRPI